MKVLVVGAGGNLGAYFSENSVHKECLQKISRKESSDSKFTISPKSGINLPNDYSPDLIINFANAYFPSPNPLQVEKMRESIVGVSEFIAEASFLYKVPVIAFSSYFQYPPIGLRPWSEYSQLKDQSIEIIRRYANQLIEVTLGDNYGGKRRDKFFDVALSANLKGIQFDANPGDSLLNLVHLKDICRGIDQIISTLDTYRGHQHFELRDHNAFTLREIVSLIDSVRGIKTKVNWGAIPYRNKEVFEEWKCAEALDSWQPTFEIRRYIQNYSG